MKVLLEYNDDTIELVPGETFVGRGLSCRIRFNDPAVSRRHIRFLVNDSSAQVEDLESTNGTRINGEPLVGSLALANADELQIGHRLLRVRVIGSSEEQTMEDEKTVSSVVQWPTTVASRKKTPSRAAPKVDLSLLGDVSLAKITQQNCRRCRARLPIDAEICPSCNYRIMLPRAMSVTQRISQEALERRLAHRYPVEIPVFYSSDTLTFDAMARDLSYGGIFIASELLDPEGTPCSITLLPDGNPPISFAGVVCHVISAATGEDGRPPGLGIKLTKMSKEAMHWLSSYLERQPTA